jgi:hypothetical protein
MLDSFKYIYSAGSEFAHSGDLEVRVASCKIHKTGTGVGFDCVTRTLHAVSNGLYIAFDDS